MIGQGFTVICCMGFVACMGCFISLMCREKDMTLARLVALVWNGATAGGCLALIDAWCQADKQGDIVYELVARLIQLVGDKPEEGS